MCVDRQQQGFTLIEILLVIVIATVLSAMVAPAFFESTGASVRGEARYMQKVLRLAAEETQLTGRLVRCSVYADHILFETQNRNGEWKNLQGSIFQTPLPQPPVKVLEAHLNGDVGINQEALRDGEKPPLARFMFWPDGQLSAGEVILGLKGGDEKQVLILRSGLAGIYVQGVVR